MKDTNIPRRPRTDGHGNEPCHPIYGRLPAHFGLPGLSFLLPLLLSLIASPPLRAGEIKSQATDLGGGQWQYTYTLSGFDLAAGEFIAIYFDANLFSNLGMPIPPNADWDMQVFQPDPGIPADGELDLIALVGSPSLADVFTETVTYLGSGTPGPQPFTVYDTGFSPVSSGQTAVPEPPMLPLLLGGFLGLALARGKRALPLLCLLGLASFSAQAEIRVTGRTLVGTTRASLTDYNYTYTVQVKNLGEAATNVSAVVSSFAPATTVVQGSLAFPDLPAGGTATSTNTYTIRQKRTEPIDQSRIRFAFSAISTPVADAGPDQFIDVLNKDVKTSSTTPPFCCQVNARDSYDPFGLPLTYRWTLVSQPAGSTAALSAGTVVANFAPDQPGDYTLQLVVNNGHRDSAPSYVRLSTVAVPPKADAGHNRTIKAGQTVQLDGSRSVNPMNRPLSYAWSFVSAPAGSHPALSDPGSPRPAFVAAVAGTYTLQLQVADGALASAPATVTFTTGNTPPRADAGPDLHIFENSYGFLSANRSTDVNGDFLTYRWAILSGPADQPTPAPVPNPDFFLPWGGAIHVQLFVNDGYSESSSTLLVSTQWISYWTHPAYGVSSVLPAIAAVAPHGPAPAAYTLDASPSLSSDIIKWDSWPMPQLASWTLRESPADSGAGIAPSGAMAATVTPDRDGLYVAQVRTQDWGFWSYPTAVSFLTHGDLPVADPGSTQFGLWTAPTPHTLDGSASYDPDGAALTYRWSLLSRPLGSKATLSSATAVAPTFMADVDGTYVFQLVVNNGQSDSLPATVSVISKDNVAPTAIEAVTRHPWRSPCVPVSVLGDEPEMDAYGLYGELLSLPSEAFLTTGDSVIGNFMTSFGIVGTPGINPEGRLGAYTMCYIPFYSTFTGLDSFTYRIWDMGYPSGCTTPGNYCIAPKTSAPATYSIEIYEISRI